MHALPCQCGCVYRLRIEPVVEGEKTIDLPCDAAGAVDLDALDETGRNAYFYARIVHRMRLTARVVPVGYC